MASPATKSCAAAVGGGRVFDDQWKLVEGGFNGDQDVEQTCDWRAGVLKQLFSVASVIKGPLGTLLNQLSGGGLLQQIEEGRGMKDIDPESEEYRTFTFMMDRRDTLMLAEVDGENYVLEVSVLASKFAYENQKAALKLVTNNLQGGEYRYFDCWNRWVGEKGKKSTQAIGFVRFEGRGSTIYVAFRGSELTSPEDWETNVDCGHLTMGNGYGRVHKGFMKALGLLSDTGDFDRDFPSVYPSRERKDERPAYYAIREWLAKLSQTSVAGRLRVVGHSQGGALAILFATMLLYHDARDLPIDGDIEVITLGQPRVGDSNFANLMTRTYIINPTSFGTPKLVYKRMVYRHDPVPRVPFDDDPCRRNYSRYRHFGTCLYYNGCKSKNTVPEAPMANFKLTDATYAGGAQDLKDWAEDENIKVELSTLTKVLGVLYLYPVLFHTNTCYLNAARHGRETPPPRNRRERLLRALLQYYRRRKLRLEQKSPAGCCWNGCPCILQS